MLQGFLSMINLEQHQNSDKLFLNQLREKILTKFIILLIIIATIFIIIDNILNGTTPLWLLGCWFLILLICSVCFQLKRRSIQLANHVLLLGLFIMFVGVTNIILLEPIILISVIPIFLLLIIVLLERWYSFLYMVAIIGVVPTAFPSEANIVQLPYLTIICFTYFAILTIYEAFYEILTNLNNYQQYALDQMQEARDSRGLLAKRTKSLTETTEKLVYANRQLRIAKHKVEEAQKLKAQFAANVSHELRTPINIIVGFAESIVRFPNVYGTPLPSVYLTDIRTIYRNGKHLQNLINDVLDISQIESGHMAITKEEIHIATIIRETVRMMHDQIKRKGLDFVVDIPNDIPRMWLDRVRIRQVFINLLGNAIRFTHEGSISITVYLEGDNLMICVADTGIGIDPAEKDLIFEEFYQTRSLSFRGEGSGLGLTLCQRFVRLHNGELWVESAGINGLGSQFWIKLPLETTSYLVKPIEGRPLALEKKMMLVCNDDPKVIEFFERHISKLEVIGIKNAKNIEKLVSTRPAAIVLDHEDADNGNWKNVLTSSGYTSSLITCSMPSGRHHMRDLGVADYLVKPVSVDALKDSLVQLVSEPQRILIVDDDKEIVRLFGRWITAIIPKCTLMMAYSGQEALALLEMQAPDLVILDILMPDVDGLTVLELIKSSEKLKDIPVIIASAKGASEAISTSDDGRLNVQKPSGFQPLELVQCIEAVVDTLSPFTQGLV